MNQLFNSFSFLVSNFELQQQNICTQKNGLQIIMIICFYFSPVNSTTTCYFAVLL